MSLSSYLRFIFGTSSLHVYEILVFFMAVMLVLYEPKHREARWICRLVSFYILCGCFASIFVLFWKLLHSKPNPNHRPCAGESRHDHTNNAKLIWWCLHVRLKRHIVWYLQCDSSNWLRSRATFEANMVVCTVVTVLSYSRVVSVTHFLLFAKYTHQMFIQGTFYPEYYNCFIM